MLLAAALCALLLASAACARRGMGNHVVAQNEAFVLTGDSLVEGGIVATASTPQHIESSLTRERLDSIAAAYARHAGADTSSRAALPTLVGGKPWRAAGPHDGYPQFECPQRLVEAIHNMNLDHIAEGSEGRATFAAEGDTARLLTAIALSLAWLEPQRSQRTLQQLAPGGRIAPLDGWPASATHLAWAAAAWNVYLATGDRHWLAQLHNVLLATLAYDARLLADPVTNLLHGGTQHRAAPYPSWMLAADVAQTQPLAANTLAAHAYQILAAADEELGLLHNHDGDAQRLKDAINQQLWDEPMGCYSAYLYGPSAPLRAPVSDNLAQALAVLWDIADDDRATTLLERTPVGHHGVSPSWPDEGHIEPYFAHPSWPSLQALWVMAAAHTGNEEMMRRGLAALLRAQALFESRHIAQKGLSLSDLCTAASSMAVTLRVLAGLRLTTDGLEFAPMVPACLPGDKTLRGLRYRQAVLDITLRGTGNDVAGITIDGQRAQQGFVPATLTGHHTIVVELQPGHTQGSVTLSNPGVALPPTPEVVWTADSGCVTNYVAGGSYRLVTNGALGPVLSDMAFALTDATTLQGATVLSVAMAGRRCYGFAARPIVVSGSDSYTISITPQPGPDSLTVELTAARGGQHLLQVDYTGPATGCDALLVSANTHHQGGVLLPGAPSGGTATSTTLTIALLRGRNRLTLTRPPGIPPRATPTTLRIIKK